MGVSGEEAITYAEDVAEELAPVFEEEYDITVDTPVFKGTKAGYCGLGTAMEYLPTNLVTGPDSAGVVKVREDINWSIPNIRGTTGHELGHAALYQNSDFGDLRENDDYDQFVLSSISEGIAQEFQRDAFRYYMNGGGTSVLEKVDYLARRSFGNSLRGITDVTCSTAETVTGDGWRSDYSRGRAIFRGSSKEEVLDAITDPEQLYQEVVDSA